AGRLKVRTWARGITTTYSYTPAGELQALVYSDTTTGVTNTYNRLGELSTVIQGSNTCNYLYNDARQVVSERASSGALNGLAVTNIYDTFLRRTTNGILNGSSWLVQTRYVYDFASRLLSASDGTNSATYSYLENSPLVSQ